MLRSSLLCSVRSFPLDHKSSSVTVNSSNQQQQPIIEKIVPTKTAVAATCSADSAGTSSDSHSQCTVAGTAMSSASEAKLSASLPSGSRSEIHYPNIYQYSSNIYSCKKKRKLVRLMTVLAYVFAVSLVAIILSLYYLFLWDPYIHSTNQPNSPAITTTSTVASVISAQLSNDNSSKNAFFVQST